MSEQATPPQIALIADDDEMARLMLTEAVEQAGLEAVVAADGASALTLGRHTDFAIALLDVEMPVLDGYHVCESLRTAATSRFAPIVMITGHDDAASVDRAYQVGATDFMSKPLNWPLIPHRLRYLLRNAASLRELDRREAENRVLLESIPDRIHLLDPAGRVRRMLRAPADGTAPAAQDIDALVPSSEIVTARRCLAATARDGQARSHEYSEAAADGSPGHFEMRYFYCGSGEIMAMRQDITSRREQEERIREMAYFDTLTGLPNRQSFVEQVESHLESIGHRDLEAAVLYLDLNGFKRVNDTFGHAVGDRILRGVAIKLKQCLEALPTIGTNAELARFGGDEFVLFIQSESVEAAALNVANRINAAFVEPLTIEGRDFFVTLSTGIALFPAHGQDVDALLKNADTAMYQAKAAGASRRVVYSSSMSERAQEWLALDAHLRCAVREQMFELYYQPKFRLSNGGLAGAEVLLRWFHPELGEVSPGRFIPLAEESGLILELGAWVVQAACRQLRHWQDRGIQIDLAVNISGKEFMHGDPVGVLRAATAASGIDPRRLEIEITESVLISDSARIQNGLGDLRDLGCRIALDDFGTGYSSLAYLKRFPPNSLKIDRAFIQNIHRDRGDAAIFEAILSLSRSLDLEVVAEGVEEPEQLEWLREHGCTMAQGFLLGRPMPAHRLEALFEDNTPVPGAASAGAV